MQVLDAIEAAQDGRAMANLAAVFGIGEEEARSAAQAVVPELALALERNTLSRGGLADLVRALGSGHHEAILETPAAWSDPRVAADGQAILDHILGSAHKSRVLAARAARASGLGEGILQMLLPILAQLLMGALAKATKGGLGDVLSRLPIPGGGAGQREPRSRDFDTGGSMGDGRGFELPRVELPPGGGFPMPPIPGGTDEARSSRETWPGPVSDPNQTSPRPPQADPPAGQGGYPLPRYEVPPEGGNQTSPGADGGGRGLPFPFPLPGPSRGDNPYGDLSDILKRGGSMPKGNDRGDGLWSVIRSVLGGALGFGGRGVLGWIIQFIVMRWGWRILQRILLGR